ncbi:Alpha/beta hydrolase family protein [Corynebacterium pelargi]|uniref:Alpha/beta hydrolase family protein n=1 Tax=Corynebacterium pelargi TaxID=1471400 RepID=A0A410W6M5_9CORY|nr:Alpha/beta hydrolase family protein [Corynebacterium pelargi]
MNPLPTACKDEVVLTLPTILLPGLGIPASAWNNVKAHVPNAYATDRLDSHSPLSLEGQVNRVIEFMDDRDIDQAQLVAHSMASFIGEAACRLHPERFTRLILVDGSYEERRKACLRIPIEKLIPHATLRAIVQEWRCYSFWANELREIQRSHPLRTRTVVIAAYACRPGRWVRKLRRQAQQLSALFVPMKGSHRLMLDRPEAIAALIREDPPQAQRHDGYAL